MFKKIVCLFAIASMLFATSCSNEELQTETEANAQVSFNISIGNKMTRAISDGLKVDQLMYAVFDQNGQLVTKKTSIDNIKFSATNGYTLSLSLPNGKTFKVVFWAQDDDCSAYTVSDDMNVKVNYTGVNNDESRDAFFAATEPFTVNGPGYHSVTLKRPFAQVNVGTDEFDWNTIYESGKIIISSSATIKGVADQINLLDGSLSGSVDVTYSLANIPQELLNADLDNDGIKEAFRYLSMSYILANNEKSIHQMSFQFAAEDKSTINLVDGLNIVPILRNWTTNILGQILSGRQHFNIQIDPSYNDEYIYYLNDGYLFTATENTTFENRTFSFNNLNAETHFGSTDGQLITFNDVTFTGKIWAILLGQYRNPSYVNYNNELNNVVLKDLIISNGVADQNNFMSVAVCAFGNTTLNNCVMKGTTSTADAKYIVYDLGVRNYSTATINGGEYGRLYFWPATNVTINNSKVGIIDSSISTIKNVTSSLVIANGTTVDQINFTHLTNYAPRVTVEAGAVVNVMNLINTKIDNIVINGTVKKFTYNGVEYTWEQLQEMNK